MSRTKDVLELIGAIDPENKRFAIELLFLLVKCPDFKREMMKIPKDAAPEERAKSTRDLMNQWLYNKGYIDLLYSEMGENGPVFSAEDNEEARI